MGCIIAVIAIQVGSYVLWATERIPSIALQLTPEKMHFAKGTSFSWVLLSLEECQNLTDNQKMQLLSLFRNQYSAVYMNKSELPADAYIDDSKGKISGYYKGYFFDFSVISRGLFWITVSHNDYEALLASSSGKHMFIWFCGRWVYYYSMEMAVS